MFSNTQLKTAGTAFALALVVISLAVGATGGVVAQEGTATPTPTATDSGPTELVNSTVEIDNDTRSVYADVAAGNSSVEVDVAFVGIGPNGTETELETPRTVTVNAGETQLVERSELDTSEHDAVRVKVTAPSGTDATAEAGEIAKVAGGSGGGLGGAVEQAGGIGVVVVAGGAAILILRGRADD